jgi:hypothetical protein
MPRWPQIHRSHLIEFAQCTLEHAELRRGGKEVIDGDGQIRRSDVVAVPGEDSLNRKPADSERKCWLRFQKIL